MICVGMFGTFDIANFGDVLFPIVAEKKLAQFADVDVVKFSYNRKTSTEWYYDVEPISELPNLIGTLDLALVGGGHLIHFNREMAEGYFPESGDLPHPLGFWWLPALAGFVGGVPVAINGVSADPHLPVWGGPLLKSFLGVSDYISVRDVATAATLSAFAPADRIHIIPDTVFSISDLIERDKYSAEYKAFREDLGLTHPYMIVQPSDALAKYKPEIVNYINEAKTKGWQVLELPIGFGIGNYTGFYGVSDLIRPNGWPSPLLLAEIIANAEAAIGISLHLSVVASSFGIPALRPQYSRSSKFIVLDGLPNIAFLDQKAPLCGRSEYSADLALIAEYKRSLDDHWASLIALAKSERPRSADRLKATWDQLRATPDALRCQRGWRDVAFETGLHLKRRRHFLMHTVRKMVR